MIGILLKKIMEYLDEYLAIREERRKGFNHEFEFCHKCQYVHEYRVEERQVFVRCRSCRHVHLKRDMTAREHTHMLHYELQSTTEDVETIEPARMGATEMVNDGKRFLNAKERKAYIGYCENMTQFYRGDKYVQFHILDDFELMEYVEAYRHDEATESVLDEICDGKGGK